MSEESFIPESNGKCCEFCHAEDGKERIIGGFIVQLKPIEIEGQQKLACQSCSRKYVPVLLNQNIHLPNNTTMKNFFNIKKLAGLFGRTTAVLFLLSVGVYAQPMLPSEPSQAPIDGGLSILAAAGGAYAIKKLKDKKSEKL